MEKNYKGRIITSRFRLVLVITSALFVIATCLIYLMSAKNTEDLLAEQMLHRETVLVRAGSQTIKEYFKYLEDRLLFMAALEKIVMPEAKQTHTILAESKNTLSSTVSDIVRIDKTGAVIACSSIENCGDASVEDREYFSWAENPSNKGKVYYSDILVNKVGSGKGERVVVMATPVYLGDKFDGVLSIIISLDKFADDYVLNLKITEGSRPFLLSDTGVILASVYPELVGAKSLDIIKGNTWKGYEAYVKATKRVMRGEEGTAIYNYKTPDGVTTSLTAFTPITFAGSSRLWSLGIAVPKDESSVYFAKFSKNLILLLLVIISMLLCSFVIIIYVARMVQKDAFLEGFTTCMNAFDLKNKNDIQTKK